MKKRFSKGRHLNEDMVLQITSMADVFTIILVFLLKTASTGIVSISPSADVMLPEAHAGIVPSESLKLEISPSTISVEGKPITQLHAFQFDSSDLTAAGTSKSLEVALKRERDRQLLIAKSNTEVKVDPKIMVISDQKAPYLTIKTALATAAVHGFTDFKLVVVEKE